MRVFEMGCSVTPNSLCSCHGEASMQVLIAGVMSASIGIVFICIGFPHVVLQTSANADRTNEYDDMRIRVWRAFGVGTGKLVQLSDVKADLKALVPLEVDTLTQHENSQWKQEASSQGTSPADIVAESQVSSANIFR